MANDTPPRRNTRFRAVAKHRRLQHVMPAMDGGWSVRRGGSLKATRHFDTKQEAEVFARELSIRQQAELVIHRRDGTVQGKEYYGPDSPHPHKPR